ncbi:hypothetical protein BK675_15995 [Pseudomonas fluorescens]|nr:hypothetical protein BK677_25885 [Pseudomonas fluorescens]ROO06998.1 hypothetical protein BK675_15995 [Pseudomonas fluorescens]ROO14864.1 hypothetical protein BK676_20565 [Pseudomonas fluorescens]
MSISKGPLLEELVRAYFTKQGFYAIRSVPFTFEGNDVTDIDVWLYSRQTASVRIKAIVDVKNKKSPKAYERILWVKGLQSILKCDRAIIATTDENKGLAKFAYENNISVLSKGFLDRLDKKINADARLSLEEFNLLIHQNSNHKHDGDWIKVLAETKSAIASLGSFPAFNKAMMAFHFFADRMEVRSQHSDQLQRCLLSVASLACIALDGALEKLTFQDAIFRFEGVKDGITYGDGDGKFRQSLELAFRAISENVVNGKTLASQARENIGQELSKIRADLIAEYFTREHNAQALFGVAKEMDEKAFAKDCGEVELSVEARSILGVFADFVRVKRSVLPISRTTPSSVSKKEGNEKEQTDVSIVESRLEKSSQGKLL